VVLPAFLLILSFGVDSIGNGRIRSLLLVSFCLLSLIDIFIVKKYYSTVHKAQFREQAKFISTDTSGAYPVIAEVTAWHQQYYLRKYGFKAGIIAGSMDAAIDSIRAKAGSRGGLQGFWLSDGHGGQKPSADLVRRIDSSFVLIKHQDFSGAWAQLYVYRSLAGRQLHIGSFPAPFRFRLGEDSVIAVWDAHAVSATLPLNKGVYSVNMMMKGTPVKGVYPHMMLKINGLAVGSLSLTANFENYSFRYTHPGDTAAFLEILMDNDANDPGAGEDRNAFIRSISFLRTAD
jgi:hypothetical protein